jgi:hypothetical protein
VDTGIKAQGPQGPKGDPGNVGSAATIQAGSAVTIPYNQPPEVTNSGNSTNAIFDFKIPQGRPAFTTYRANLSSSTSPALLIPLKELTLRIVGLNGSNIDMYLDPSRSIRVDVRRFTVYGTGNEQFVINDNEISTSQHIDNGSYADSNENWTVWIRQQDQGGLWSLHEVQLFSSANGARTTAWVSLIEENVDYNNPSNP